MNTMQIFVVYHSTSGFSWTEDGPPIAAFTTREAAENFAESCGYSTDIEEVTLHLDNSPQAGSDTCVGPHKE